MSAEPFEWTRLSGPEQAELVHLTHLADDDLYAALADALGLRPRRGKINDARDFVDRWLAQQRTRFCEDPRVVALLTESGYSMAMEAAVVMAALAELAKEKSTIPALAVVLLRRGLRMVCEVD